MSDFTPRANLRLPGGGSTGTILPDEQVDIDVLNDNFRKIDALLGARNIPSASSYSGSMDGDLVYARDTKYLHMFSANDGGLITPRLPGSTRFKGTTAEMNAFAGAQEGDSWFNTTNNSEYVRLGAAWVNPKRAFGYMALTSGQANANAWSPMYGANSTWGPMVGDFVYADGIKVPLAGTYRVSVSASVTVGSVPFIIGAKRNNKLPTDVGLIVAQSFIASSPTSLAMGSASRLVNLSADDVITPIIYTSGTTGPYGINPSHTSCSVELVSAA